MTWRIRRRLISTRDSPGYAGHLKIAYPHSLDINFEFYVQLNSVYGFSWIFKPIFRSPCQIKNEILLFNYLKWLSTKILFLNIIETKLILTLRHFSLFSVGYNAQMSYRQTLNRLSADRDKRLSS